MYSVVLATMLSTGAAAPEWGCCGCHGCCCGGYFVYSCHGCHGCWGCHGCHGCWGCHGCRGCYCSGCYCSGCYCSGCYCSGCSCSGCHCSGCYCSGCYGCSCFGYNGGVIILGQNASPQTVVVAQTPPATNAKDVARITVRLPGDAKLFVDNSECPLTSEVRTFSTPKLEQGKKYYYTFKAEVVQNGRTVVQSQRVIMTAGQQVNVDFGSVTSTAWTAKR